MEFDKRYYLKSDDKVFYRGNPDEQVVDGVTAKLKDALPGLDVTPLVSGVTYKGETAIHGAAQTREGSYNTVYQLISAEEVKGANLNHNNYFHNLADAIIAVAEKMGLAAGPNRILTTSSMTLDPAVTKPGLYLFPYVAENEAFVTALKEDKEVQAALKPIKGRLGLFRASLTPNDGQGFDIASGSKK